MSQPDVQRPEFPALFQTIPAGRGRRVGRGLISWGLALGLGLGLAYLIGVLRGGVTLPVLAGLVGVSAALLGVLFAIWCAVGGGWLPDLILGIRIVRVTDGRRPSVGGFARSLLQSALAAATVGIVPLVAVLWLPADGRSWLDRLTGVALIDVRAGRNVLARPVAQGEVEAYFAPKPAPRPAIIEVHPSAPQPAERPWQVPATSAGETVDAARLLASRAASTSGADSTRISASPIAASADVRPPNGGTTWLLYFDTGERHLLHGLALVGRQPVARPDFRGADLIRIADPSRTVSGTHLAVTSNDIGLWVEDLGSTNGSEVRTPNGRTQVLAVRVRTAVAVGSRVRLGDRWMTVERASR